LFVVLQCRTFRCTGGRGQGSQAERPPRHRLDDVWIFRGHVATAKFNGLFPGVASLTDVLLKA